MPTEELKEDYSCTQQELYSMSRTITNAAKETADQVKLSGFKALYTNTYLNGLLTEVTAAETLPDEVLREDKHETDRVDLQGLLKPCLENFQFTKSYIDTAYEKQYRKLKYDTAGGAKYENASNENWEFAEAMNNDVLAFITANQTLLESGNNMPTTFIAKVTADNLAFHTKYESFKSARQTSDETQVKITANNTLYGKISLLAKDGVLVWKDNEGKRNRYVMAKVLELISPPGSASLDIEVLAPDFLPRTKASITLEREGVPAIKLSPNEKGHAVVSKIDPGRYRYTVTLPPEDGGLTKTGKKDVNTGVDARLKVIL